jgi:hypothetical protein
MMRTSALAAILFAAGAGLAAGGCGDAGGGGDAGTGTDTDTDSDGGSTLGAIEVAGNWDGAQPDGVTFKTAVFACPFTMPPEYSDLDGTIDSVTGDVHGLIEEVEPGEWCLMAYVDMNPDDGLQPVAGTDAVNATGDENVNGALAIDVIGGEITVVDLVFEIQ